MINRTRDSKFLLYVIVGALFLLGGIPMYYRTAVHGVSLVPGKREPVWLVEARVTFNATGGPVKVSLSIPRRSPGFQIFDENVASAGYGFDYDTSEGDRRAVWVARDVKGPQVLFYRVQVFDARGADQLLRDPSPPKPSATVPEGAFRTAGRALVDRVRQRSADAATFAAELLRQLNSDTPSADARLLLQPAKSETDRLNVAISLLAMEGIPARIARGVYLEDGKRRQPFDALLEVYTGRGWQFFDPATGTAGLPKRFVLWQRGGQSLLDVEGARHSRVTISVIRNVLPEKDLAAVRTKSRKARSLDLSIYQLPVEEQNVIKKLLLIPLGALVVIVIRNLIGIDTAGTFMPVLIALAFLETKLLTGLMIFLVVIAVGLLIRGQLSRLNLLLVPRISAVLIVVIILMMGISLLSYKLDLHQGLRVTFFPMIVLSWTIERGSVTAEEMGSRAAVIQIAGSILTAVIAYLLMSNRYVEHILFAFPEVTLILLGVVLLLGTYTGYRLTELWRFEPLTRRD